MRYIALALLVVAALAITACSGNVSQTLAPEPSPTTAAAPTAMATDTPALIPTLAPLPTNPPAPATATQPAATTAPTSGSTGGATTYTSQNLGIRFSYLPQADGQKFGVQETGDKVYVYAGSVAPTTGQWVQVLSKAPDVSLVDAIKAQVLKGYSLQDCLASTISNPNSGFTPPAGYSFAAIKVPTGPNDDPETLQYKASKCPQPYAAIGGLAYFVADSAHPDRFAFFSIGQYGIMGPNGAPWQTTLQFIGAGTGGTPNTYLDDRSTGASLLQSFVNALNRKEYARAYSYWESGSQVQPFPQFQQGYANTASVQLTVGTVQMGAAAGNIYYSVPVVMIALQTNGSLQTFAGCYTTHLPQPANFGAPPIQPMAIQSADVHQVANTSNTVALLQTACPAGPGPALVTSYAPDDISANRYLDDRSDPVQVLRSLYNAVNRREYVRSYSYWETAAAAAKLPPYSQFEQGYANTASVQLRTGTVKSDAGAGQIYYRVPVALTAQITGGAAQTFVGCYTLHLSNPGIQAAPPFHPLAVTDAQIRQVANNADTTALMANACQ